MSDKKGDIENMGRSPPGFEIEIEEIDDGHSPGGTSLPTQLVSYQGKQSVGFLSVYDNLLPELWRERTYDYALGRPMPWGVYVTMADALNSDESVESLWESGQHQQAIALQAVRSLLLERGRAHLDQDLPKLHGTAVWCLTSSATDEVRYHIDYAELHRYETNVIFPPVYAGTCHVSPVHTSADMVGGAFRANTSGLPHYKRFGYKTKLQSAETFAADQTQAQWLSVPYLSNRGILHDGDFPHLSTEITHIEPSLRRVILGFNVFTDHVADCNMRAPEHSDAFNRTIKLYQRMRRAGIPVTFQEQSSTTSVLPPAPDAAKEHEGRAAPDTEEDGKYGTRKSNATVPSATTHSNASEAPQVCTEASAFEKKKKAAGGISVQEVMKNPALARLLIQAAKKAKGLT